MLCWADRQPGPGSLFLETALTRDKQTAGRPSCSGNHVIHVTARVLNTTTETPQATPPENHVPTPLAGKQTAHLGHVLPCDRLHHVRPSQEHVRGVPDHESEVGEGGGVDRAARTGAQDEADLRDHACGRHKAWNGIFSDLSRVMAVSDEMSAVCVSLKWQPLHTSVRHMQSPPQSHEI